MCTKRRGWRCKKKSKSKKYLFWKLIRRLFNKQKFVSYFILDLLQLTLLTYIQQAKIKCISISTFLGHLVWQKSFTVRALQKIVAYTDAPYFLKFCAIKVLFFSPEILDRFKNNGESLHQYRLFFILVPQPPRSCQGLNWYVKWYVSRKQPFLLNC